MQTVTVPEDDDTQPVQERTHPNPRSSVRACAGFFTFVLDIITPLFSLGFRMPSGVVRSGRSQSTGCCLQLFGPEG